MPANQAEAAATPGAGRTDPALLALELKAVDVSNEAQAIQIEGQETYDRAIGLWKGAKQLRDQIVELFRPMKETAFKAHRTVCDREKRLLEPIDKDITALNRQIVQWDAEQERVRREAQRHAEEVARQKAREEQEALAREAEEAGYSPESVEAIRSEEPVVTSVAPVEPTYEKSRAYSVRDNWKAEVTDFKAFVAWCVKTKQLGYLQVNAPALGALARSQRDTAAIPGLRVYSEKVTATRSR